MMDDASLLSIASTKLLSVASSRNDALQCGDPSDQSTDVSKDGGTSARSSVTPTNSLRSWMHSRENSTDASGLTPSDNNTPQWSPVVDINVNRANRFNRANRVWGVEKMDEYGQSIADALNRVNQGQDALVEDSSLINQAIKTTPIRPESLPVPITDINASGNANGNASANVNAWSAPRSSIASSIASPTSSSKESSGSSIENSTEVLHGVDAKREMAISSGSTALSNGTSASSLKSDMIWNASSTESIKEKLRRWKASKETTTMTTTTTPMTTTTLATAAKEVEDVEQEMEPLNCLESTSSSSPVSFARGSLFGIEADAFIDDADNDIELTTIENDLDECKEEVEEIFRSLQSTMRRFETLQNDFDKASLMRERLYKELVEDPLLSACKDGFSASLTTNVVHPSVCTKNRFQVLESRGKSE